MKYNYKPQGVCAMNISFDLEDDIVKNVVFTGGCDGNHKGLSALCEGRTADEIIQALSGIKCGMRSTSCPDQLAKAIAEAASNN